MQDKLLQLQKQWRLTALLVQIVWALSASLVLALVFKGNTLLYGSIAFAIVLTVLLFINRGWRLPVKSLVQHLNQTYPALEESVQLLLPAPPLPAIQQLQQNKVSERLQALNIRSPFQKPLLRSIVFLLLAIVFFAGVQQWAGSKTISSKAITPESNRKETILASIQSATLTIVPPAYTQLQPRRQAQFSLRAEAGANVNWQLLLNAPASQVSLLFNDGSSISMQSSNEGSWQAAKTIRQSGFYQVKIDGRLSELYSIEAIKDAPPVINVQSPQPSVSLSFFGAQKFLWQSRVTDDYGLVRLQLTATVASGQGEAVKFREQQIPWPIPGTAKMQNVQHAMDCHTLKMQPGDEVYLWLSATDNYGQEARSDVYVVSLQDTSGQITIDGLLSGLNVKPELFRSQRQIIIETEQLLRDQKKISAQQFKEKSNELGIDQKLLRLRYGKFLGEEFSAEIGGDDHDGESHTEGDDATALIETYSHNHDNAEDATYFDPATKRQLKAMLSEMWNSELKLRTFLPKEALPYEYKALRLLKDLQQKSRAYVPKTTFTPAPFPIDKRLSGDVSKVASTIRQQTITSDDSLLLLRKAIGILEELKTSGELTSNNAAILQAAYQQLSAKAAAQPAIYLEALSGYRKVMGDDFRLGDIRAAQKGLQQMLPAPPALPHASAQGSSLSKAYFDNLRKSQR